RNITLKHITNGSNHGTLRKLNVIVAGHNWHMRQPVLDAIDRAVSDGVGLLEQAGFAKLTPSFTDQVCELSAMKHAELFSNATGGRCVVVASHPLLADRQAGEEMARPVALGASGAMPPEPSGLVTAPGLAPGGLRG